METSVSYLFYNFLSTTAEFLVYLIFSKELVYIFLSVTCGLLSTKLLESKKLDRKQLLKIFLASIFSLILVFSILVFIAAISGLTSLILGFISPEVSFV